MPDKIEALSELDAEGTSQMRHRGVNAHEQVDGFEHLCGFQPIRRVQRLLKHTALDEAPHRSLIVTIQLQANQAGPVMLPPLLGQLEEGLPGHITHPGAALRLGGLVAPGTPNKTNTQSTLFIFCWRERWPFSQFQIRTPSCSLGSPLLKNYREEEEADL